MGKTSIEWADYTFNPWIGCTKVSPGCAHCYAEGESKRRGWAQWGKGKDRHRTSEHYWKQPEKWNLEARKTGKRFKVFCGSLCDWLDDEVPIEWLADLLALIHATPNLDWLLLTKRPENFEMRESEVWQLSCGTNEPVRMWLGGWSSGRVIPQNVWFGVSVEDQGYADERIPLLLQIPAKIRFLSCEPLLGPVDLSKYLTGEIPHFEDGVEYLPDRYPRIDWVICGGESGPRARPMHPDLARSLRDECVAAGVPFFFKQWGEFGPESYRIFLIAGSKIIAMQRLGKKRAGRLLDGREWNEFPKTAPSAVATEAEAIAR